MRLIDADRLLEKLKWNCERNCKKCGYSTFLTSDEHCGLIDEQPTAYDQEQIINQIHEYFKKVIDDSKSGNIPLEVLTYNKDICEIVRQGGVK